MAKYQQKEGTGSLFKNERREKDTHPHATGTALIGGVEYWVSAWTKDGKSGKFQSLAFKPKTSAGKPQTGKLEEDEDVPFARCDLDSDVIYRKLRWGNE